MQSLQHQPCNTNGVYTYNDLKIEKMSSRENLQKSLTIRTGGIACHMVRYINIRIFQGDSHDTLLHTLRIRTECTK